MVAALYVLVAAAGGCGPSSQEIRTAETARYALRRDLLWTEIMKVVRSRFPRLEVARVDADRLTSQWSTTGHRVQVAGGTTSVLSGTMTSKVETTPELVRVTVLLTGQNPYQVTIDVEAGLFDGDMRPPFVFHHGAAEEPTWVEARNDDLALTLFNALGRYRAP